jgi:hypothetical protein
VRGDVASDLRGGDRHDAPVAEDGDLPGGDPTVEHAPRHAQRPSGVVEAEKVIGNGHHEKKPTPTSPIG